MPGLTRSKRGRSSRSFYSGAIVATEKVKQILASLKRRQEPVADDRIAQFLNISELRVGVNRSQALPCVDRWQVLAWWVVTVEPSFAPYFAVGAIHGEESIDGPGLGKVDIRGFV